LADFRKRRGTFAAYPADKPLDLVGIINCPGCPTLTGPDKLLQRIRGLSEFRIEAIHFTNCIKALCPFKEKYEKALAETFPGIKIVIGTHQEHISMEEFRGRVKKLFCQPRKTMVDMILDKD
jgi:predicted metal-binding protein